MRFGILADPHLGDNVPGTSPLDDLHSVTRATDAEYLNFKRAKDGIVLIPQPSASPNDPLNWPRWRKMMVIATLTYGAGVVGAFGPIIAAGFTEVATNLHTSIDTLSKMNGDLCLATGLVLIVATPASVIWGRRPIFLVGHLFLLAGAIWSAAAKNVGNLIASRIIGGIGMAPIVTLVQVVIADIFFVHERGLWLSVWSFAIQGGINGVSIVNGYLIQYVSWRVCFVMEAILFAVLFILTFFFVPETAYVREKVPIEQQSFASDGRKTSDTEATPGVEFETLEGDGEHVCSFWRSLRPYTGRRYSGESFWKLALRPFTLLCSPVVTWGALVNGTTDAWAVAISVSVSLLFSSPEYGYNFPPGTVGLISGVGPMIGAMLGNALAGPLSDWSVTVLSRYNKGIYEPEFRLLMIVPMLVFTTMGWFGWAISAHLQQLWIGPAVFFSLINFGLAIGSIGVFAYVVDAHGNYTAESFSAINLVKAVFIFVLTYFFVPWLNSQGILRTFCIVGGINLWVCLMTVPMYIYGKRARSWVHRTPWMLT